MAQKDSGPMRDSPASLIKVTAVRSIPFIPPSDWLRLTSNKTFYVSYGWLAAMEADGWCATSYLLAHDADGALLGALPCYLWDGREEESALARNYDPFHLVRPWAAKSGRATWFPSLLMGSCSGYENEGVLLADSSKEQSSSVIAKLLEASAALAKRERVESMALMYAGHSA